MGELGSAAGGRREGVPVIAAAAVAAGADGVFLEFHPDPDKALCDGPSCLPLASARDLLAKLKALYQVVAGGAEVSGAVGRPNVRGRSPRLFLLPFSHPNSPHEPVRPGFHRSSTTHPS